jgi:SAM-dependent methyltransferase
MRLRARWDRVYRDNPSVWGVRANPLVEALVASLSPPALVLDLGCGTGRDCHRLASRGLTVIGVDISEQALRQARAILPEEGHTLEFQAADYYSVLRGLPSQHVDGILAVNSLSYAGEAIDSVFSQIFRVLRPSGLLSISLFSTEDEEHAGVASLGLRTYDSFFGRTRLCSAADVRGWLDGFVVRRLWHDSYIDRPHPGAPSPHRNAFWRAIAQKPT